MAIKLNNEGFLWAQNRINSGEFLLDTTKDATWFQHAPTNTEKDHFFDTHSVKEYGQWFLGRDLNQPETSNKHWVYPYGDFQMVHKGGLEDVVKRANEDQCPEIANAAKELLNLINKSKSKKP